MNLLGSNVWRGGQIFRPITRETCNFFPANEMHRLAAQKTVTNPYPKSQPLSSNRSNRFYE
jgi:hypothetical protein